MQILQFYYRLTTTKVIKETKISVICKRHYPGGREVGHVSKALVETCWQKVLPTSGTNICRDIIPYRPSSTALVIYKPPLPKVMIYKPMPPLFTPKFIENITLEHAQSAEKHKQKGDILLERPKTGTVRLTEHRDFKKEIIPLFPSHISIILIKIENNQFIDEKEKKVLKQYIKENPSGQLQISPSTKEFEENIQKAAKVNPSEYHKFMKELFFYNKPIPAILFNNYENLLNNKEYNLTEADKQFLKDLQQYFKIKQDIYLKGQPQGPITITDETEIAKSIRLLYETKIPNRCFTLEEFKLANKFYKDCDLLLNNVDLTEKEKISLIEHAEICGYPHVYHQGMYLSYNQQTNQLLLHHENEHFKKGEGLKVNNKAFTLLEKCVDKFPKAMRYPPLTKVQTESIMNQVKNKKGIIGFMNRSDQQLKDCILFGGLDLHFIYVVEDIQDKNRYFILFMLTSAKDQQTIKLSDTQEFNADPTEMSKNQRMRLCKKIYSIAKEDFEPHTSGTAFIRGINKQGQDVHQILEPEILKMIESNENIPIEEPLIITIDLLVTLAQLSFQEKIQEYNEIIKNLQNKTITTNKQTQLKNQSKNHMEEQEEQKFIDSFTTNEIYAYKIKKTLEKRILEEKRTDKKKSENIMSEGKSKLSEENKTSPLKNTKEAPSNV